MNHELKIIPEYYKYIRSHEKTFEIRKDDRDYKPGDVLILREWNPATREYTGHQTKRVITYILREAEQYGLKDGYCILGLQSLGWDCISLSGGKNEV